MSFRTGNKKFQVTVPSQKHPLSGTVAAAAVAGLFVCYESDSIPEDVRKLIPATGKRGAMLELAVVSKADFDAEV